MDFLLNIAAFSGEYGMWYRCAAAFSVLTLLLCFSFMLLPNTRNLKLAKFLLMQPLLVHAVLAGFAAYYLAAGDLCPVLAVLCTLCGLVELLMLWCARSAKHTVTLQDILKPEAEN